MPRREADQEGSWLPGALTAFCCSSCRRTVAGTHTASRPCTSSAPRWTPERHWAALRQSAMSWSSIPALEMSPWISRSQMPWAMGTDPHLLRNKVARKAPGSEWCDFLGRKVKAPLFSGLGLASGCRDLFLCIFALSAPYSWCGGQHGLLDEFGA